MEFASPLDCCLVPEKRHPFADGLPLGTRPASQFKPAIRTPPQVRTTKAYNDLALVPTQLFQPVFQFHTPAVWQRG